MVWKRVSSPRGNALFDVNLPERIDRDDEGIPSARAPATRSYFAPFGAFGGFGGSAATPSSARETQKPACSDSPDHDAGNDR